MKRGLPWSAWNEPIANFVQKYGRESPRWALFLTYDCDPNAVAREILPLLHRRGRAFKTVIFADAGPLQQQLIEGGMAAMECNILPVRVADNGVFHPKLMLLRAGARCLVGFGSANLTNGGFGQNFELWSTTNEPELVEASVHFLRNLTSNRHIQMSQSAQRHVAAATAGLESKPSQRFWSSFDGPFAHRVKATPAMKRLSVVSPAYASVEGIRQSLLAWSSLKIELLTSEALDTAQPHRVYDPMSDLRKEKSADEDSDRAGHHRLHAKAYLFETRTSASLWVGSANLTLNALRRPVGKGGNVEILIEKRLSQGQLRTLRVDLDSRFITSEKRPESELEREDEFSHPRGRVVAASYSPSTRKLRVETLGQSGKVVLMPQPKGRGLVVTITHGAGKVRLPAGWIRGIGESPSCALIYERITARESVPVLVNVPFLSESDLGESGTTLDAALAELTGQYSPARDDGFESEDRADEDAIELNERLDEVHQQGELDGIAVKVALLRKCLQLQEREYAERWLTHVRADVLAGMKKPHVREIVRGWLEAL